MRKGRMQKRPADLPEYDRPPVIEVALAIQFNEMERFRSVHCGWLWDLFRPKYPNLSEQPPLDPMFETFGASTQRAGPPRMEIRRIAGPPIPRLWFADEEGVELIQFQPDRFVHNWRKNLTDRPYPRYEAVKSRFLREFRQVSKFMKEHEIGVIEPNQCEVTYVNHIFSEGGENITRRLNHVLKLWRGSTSLRGIGEPEGASIVTRAILNSPRGEPVGRLHIRAEPSVSRDNRPMIVLTLVARGRPERPTLKAAEQFLDLGREAIVRGFTAITTKEMHERWGRTA